MIAPRLRTLTAVAWTVLIFGLCWTPRTMIPVSEEAGGWVQVLSFDKVIHFTLFAGFGVLWAWAGVRSGWVLALGLLAAAVSELGQETAFVNRDAEWGDGFADALGVVVALGAMSLAQRVRGGRAQSARTPSAETL